MAVVNPGKMKNVGEVQANLNMWEERISQLETVQGKGNLGATEGCDHHQRSAEQGARLYFLAARKGPNVRTDQGDDFYIFFTNG